MAGGARRRAQGRGRGGDGRAPRLGGREHRRAGLARLVGDRGVGNMAPANAADLAFRTLLGDWAHDELHHQAKLRVLLGFGCLLAGTHVDGARGAPGRATSSTSSESASPTSRGASTGSACRRERCSRRRWCFWTPPARSPRATSPSSTKLHDRRAGARRVKLYGVLSSPDIGWRESAEFVDELRRRVPRHPGQQPATWPCASVPG